jgi:hypothetical protein
VLNYGIQNIKNTFEHFGFLSFGKSNFIRIRVLSLGRSFSVFSGSSDSKDCSERSVAAAASDRSGSGSDRRSPAGRVTAAGNEVSFSEVLVGRVGVEALVPGWSGAGFIGVELTLEKKRNSFKMYIFFLLKAQE